MSEVKVGDYVRLVGPAWGWDYDGYSAGDVVRVVEVITSFGAIWTEEVGTVGKDGKLYDSEDYPDYAVELVTKPEVPFEDTVASFSSLEAPLSEGDLEDVRAAEEALGINVTYKGRPVDDLPRGALTFEQKVRRILTDVGDIVVARNKEYGNSALDPVRVFSKSDRMEQLKVQLDHKLSRIARGGDPGIDTLRDLIGYEVLYIIAMETE